jgi:hypothetical protein
MSKQIIETGDKLHIITRRLFPDDLQRHFVGEVTKAIGHLCHLQGYVFVFDSGTNEYLKQHERRTRIYSLADANHIVNVLPREIDIGALEYRTIDRRLVVTDMKGFSLDINEFGLSS